MSRIDHNDQKIMKQLEGCVQLNKIGFQLNLRTIWNNLISLRLMFLSLDTRL